MRVLLLKMSSMGDVIHLLPALTDALAHDGDITFDWVVEKPFSPLAQLHPAVKKVLPVQLRKWRKHPFKKESWRELTDFVKQLRSSEYDLIIDAQGLIKSAIVGKIAKGCLVGEMQPREKFAAKLYKNKFFISSHHHAIHRLRALFAAILNYPLPDLAPEFCIDTQQLPKTNFVDGVVFLHSTTWSTKHMPLSTWQQLAVLAAKQNCQVFLPWLTQAEHARAIAIQQYCQSNTLDCHPIILPSMTLLEMVGTLNQAKGVIAVDTGLGHIASALGVPIVSVYGATSPDKTGAYGANSICLRGEAHCSPCLKRRCIYTEGMDYPCYKTLQAKKIWQSLQNQISLRNAA